MDTPTLPPDKGTTSRKNVAAWDALWHGEYRYDGAGTEDRRAVRDSFDTADAAPGYTRSFSKLVAGLFERQTPSYEPEPVTVPVPVNDLSELMHETVAKAAGYGCVLVRPVSDGQVWRWSCVPRTRFHVRWAHRTPVHVDVWEYADDPRTDNKDAGLVFVESWTPNTDGPGTITTEVFETTPDHVKGGVALGDRIDVSDPPVDLAEHPFVMSAQNDIIRRDVFPFVWAWEDGGPVPLWYTNENVIRGLARLWDQEQDDAELVRKRVAMPEDTLGRATVKADGTQDVIARPGFNKNDNILLLASSMSAEHGPNGGVTPIEFGDDLVQRERIERRENALLEAVGINPASIGRNVAGRSDSGVAKRADNQMTMNTITAPARRMETLLTSTARELARLNNTSTGEWTIAVHEGLKENPMESADVARQLRDADAASTRTLVVTAHPTWTDEQVDTEVDLIQAENGRAPLEF